MYQDYVTSGKHLICDIKQIKNTFLLGDLGGLTGFMDSICERYGFTILHRQVHTFDPQGHTILYLLSESHFSIHTFPEKAYIALDLYTCKQYTDNSEYEAIYRHIIEAFDALYEVPKIIDRHF
jgi:S-adenosylmethionine decarboxylase